MAHREYLLHPSSTIVQSITIIVEYSIIVHSIVILHLLFQFSFSFTTKNATLHGVGIMVQQVKPLALTLAFHMDDDLDLLLICWES